MRKHLAIALALAVGLLSAPLAKAQVQNDLTGNETWQAGQGPGGPGAYITSGMVRGGTNGGLVVIGGNFTIGATDSTTGMSEGGNILLAAQPAAATITLPPNPVVNGAVIGICNTTAGAFATNVVTLAPSSGQTLSGGNITLTTLAALTCVRVQFNRPNTTWYRIQ